MPAAQRAYRLVESARYFRRGLRFGQRFPPGRAEPASDEPGDDLARYAEAHTEGPGFVKWQHYFTIYDRHLSCFRGQPVRLVEIGVAGGGSLAMWRDYFGSQARIIGVDIGAECRRFAGENVEIVIGDQGHPAFWDSFLHERDAIDVVIDDGGHLPDQQAVTLEALLPAIRPGGVYICEDIHGSMQPFHAYVDGLTRPLSDVDDSREDNPPNALQKQVASVHRYPILTVIEKLAHSPSRYEASLDSPRS